MKNIFPMVVAVRIKDYDLNLSIGGTEKRAMRTYEHFKSRGAYLIKYRDDSEVYEKVKSLGAKVVYNFGAPFSKQLADELRKLDVITAQSTNFVEAYSPYIDHNIIISKFEYLKFVLMGKINAKTSNVDIIYSPQDVEFFRKKVKPMYSRESEEEIVVGRIGRAEPTKWSSRIPAFLMWAAFSWRRTSSRKITFIFVGVPLLYRAFIDPLKGILGRKNVYIRMYPEIRDIRRLPEFYQSIDVFWQTAKIGESFGNVIAESFASGKPVITDCKYFYLKGRLRSDLYDSQIELVDNKKTGFYVNFPSQFFDLIENVEYSKLRSMGKKAIEKAYEFEKGKVMRVLEKALGGERARLDLGEIQREYTKKRDVFLKIDDEIGKVEKMYFKTFIFLYELLESVYLAIRKGGKLCGLNLEDLNLIYDKR